MVTVADDIPTGSVAGARSAIGAGYEHALEADVLCAELTVAAL